MTFEQDWRNDSRGGGTRPRKRVPKCFKGPKSTNAAMAVAENSSREVKRVHFRFILGPPGPTQEMESMGHGGEGPSRSPPPGFSNHAFSCLMLRESLSMMKIPFHTCHMRCWILYLICHYHLYYLYLICHIAICWN